MVQPLTLLSQLVWNVLLVSSVFTEIKTDLKEMCSFSICQMTQLFFFFVIVVLCVYFCFVDQRLALHVKCLYDLSMA